MQVLLKRIDGRGMRTFLLNGFCLSTQGNVISRGYGGRRKTACWERRKVEK